MLVLGHPVTFSFTTHFTSLFPPSSSYVVVPIIPVVIPVAVDLADAVSRDLVVRRPTAEIQGL